MVRPTLGPHVGHDLADEANKVQGDDLEASPPIIVGEARELPRRRTAGVVDQDVDAAEALHGGGNHPLDAVRGRPARVADPDLVTLALRLQGHGEGGSGGRRPGVAGRGDGGGRGR
jgi:hypothetical protein